MASNFIMFHIPQDEKLLAALGIVTLRHEHLNHILRMTIKSISDLTPAEAIDATQYQGSRTLRDRIRKLAKQKLKEGEPLLKLQALMTRANRLTERRNNLIHKIWAKELDGEPGLLGETGELHPLPSVEELNSLAKEMDSLTNELNDARLRGFLMIALNEKQNNE